MLKIFSLRGPHQGPAGPPAPDPGPLLERTPPSARRGRRHPVLGVVSRARCCRCDDVDVEWPREPDASPATLLWLRMGPERTVGSVPYSTAC